MGCREVLFLVFGSAIRANADGFPGLAVPGLAMPDATAKLDDFFGAIPVVFGLKCQGKREELVQVVNADLKRTGRVWGTIRFAVLLQLLEQAMLMRVLLKSAMDQKGVASCRASRNWRCSRVETIEAVSFSAEG